MDVLILVVALTLLVSGLCSLFEATLYSTRTATLEAALGGKHEHLARRFISMKNQIAVPTSAILILNTLANTGGATLAGMYAAQALGTAWVPLLSGVLTCFILFFSEILPKTYGAVHWRVLWPLIVWPLTVMEKVFRPVIGVTQRFARFFTADVSLPITTEDEIMSMIRLGAKTGELTATEHQLLDSIFHFEELVCRQVMVPRREVVFLDRTKPLSESIALAQQTKHTRYPLCDGSLDQAAGLVHIKDLLGISSDGDLDLTSVMRPLHAIPETMPISRLLRQMQASQLHMAVVVDEYGTTVGVITLENILEQIVGAVLDEFDVEPPEILAEGQGHYVVQGTVSISRLNRELDLDLGARNVTTLSGLLVSRLGRLLRQGDTIDLETATAKVLEVRDGQATHVRLKVSREAD